MMVAALLLLHALSKLRHLLAGSAMSAVAHAHQAPRSLLRLVQRAAGVTVAAFAQVASLAATARAGIMAAIADIMMAVAGQVAPPTPTALARAAPALLQLAACG